MFGLQLRGEVCARFVLLGTTVLGATVGLFASRAEADELRQISVGARTATTFVRSGATTPSADRGGSGNAIVNGSFSDGLNGWTVSEIGGFVSPGSVTVEAGLAVIREGDSFIVTLQQAFVVPENATQLKFEFFDLPGFDTSASFIPDAFEVSLLTPAFQSIVPTWDPSATSFFNVQEDGTVLRGSGVQWDGVMACVDLTGVPAGTQVILYFDFVGADADTAGGVSVDNVEVRTEVEPPPMEDGCFWNNGGVGDNGLQSQVVDGFSALVADDFLVKHGQSCWIDHFEVCFAVFGADIPEFSLSIHDDCNGKPGELVRGPFIGVGTNEGPIPEWPGFSKYRVRFDAALFEAGYRRLWLVPRGLGKGLYYWLTANSPIVQGVQGQYRSAAYGVPDWTDTDDLGPNFEECTDFNFRVCGKCCWLLQDNGDFDSSGLPSLALAGGAVFGSRSVDNFQVPPGEDVEVCRIEAWLATNCDPARAFFEIYKNDCDSPVKPAAITVTGLHAERALDGSQQPLTVGGLPVYRLTATCPGVRLSGGRDYWLAIGAVGVGTPHERAVWLFKRKDGCHINIIEGQFKNAFQSGFQSFTPVSHPGLAGEPRDFAFRLFVAEPSER